MGGKHARTFNIIIFASYYRILSSLSCRCLLSSSSLSASLLILSSSSFSFCKKNESQSPICVDYSIDLHLIVVDDHPPPRHYLYVVLRRRLPLGAAGAGDVHVGALAVGEGSGDILVWTTVPLLLASHEVFLQFGCT